MAGPDPAAYHDAMRKLTRILLLPLLLALLLPACQSLSTRSDAQKLQETLDSYAATARWQPLANLYGFLQPELQPQTLPDNLSNIRVTGYEISGPPRKLAEDRLVQVVTIEYVLIDHQVVRTLSDRQLWQRDAKGQWQRANPIPAFR